MAVVTQRVSAWDNRAIDQHGVTHLINPTCYMRVRRRSDPVIMQRVTNDHARTCLWCMAWWVS